MLAKRVVSSLVLLPVGLLFIYWGGLPYAALITLILVLAGWEYIRIFRTGGFRPAGAFVLGSILVLSASRALDEFSSAPVVVTMVIMVGMVVYLLNYERGCDTAASDFGISLGGIFYLGWIGGYLISLRTLPEGLGWVLVALPSVWAADSAAYTIGRRWGRHKLSHRLSPNKSWEGYLAGVVAGPAAGAFMGWAWAEGGLAGLVGMSGEGSHITILAGALVGLVTAGLTILGDLGESMFKRQFHVKDSGTIIPGHGGVFDRIDSWLWAGVLTYYLAVFLFI